MRPLPALILMTLFSLGAAEEPSNSDDKLNTIEPKPSVRLDPYIRKALLKALSELEEGEGVPELDTTEGISTLDTEFRNTEENSAATQNEKESIRIHSFVVNGQSAFDNNTNISPTLIDSKISIISTTVGNVANQVTATIPTQAPIKEIFQAKESGNNFQQVRSIQSSSTPRNQNSVSIIYKTTSKPTTTTSTTTTTTTPKPTHNDDGENIEEVNKQDVQVFPAPLVAAFTVHQDSHGLPKKVIPIYQQTNIQEPLKALPATNFASGVLPPQSVLKENFSPPTEFISQQLILQKQLEDKQRILEEQLRLLQLQQRQQEELLKKQQFLLQQKEVQRQQQLLFEQEQLKRQQAGLNSQKLQSNHIVNNLQSQASQKTVQQVPTVQQSIEFRPQNNLVSIQPSVSLEASNFGSQQQLPNREAVDFLIHLRSQQSQQFPLQENHLPHGISNFLQPNAVQNFHQGPEFNQLRLSDDQFTQKQGNRVFRQESGVGNFGSNSNFPRFNTFGPIYTNRYIPLNRLNNFNHDSELKQLLAQNGINGRAHEDLNIVTKVLSLNHGVPVNNVSNRLPFDSRRHVRISP